jgi:hypothetical protein
MPEICRFLGIVITMYYRDHHPPHFHAHYSGYEVSIDINSGAVDGRFPRRALGLVLEWYDTYREELLEDWRLARQRKPLKPIPPLE